MVLFCSSVLLPLSVFTLYVFFASPLKKSYSGPINVFREPGNETFRPLRAEQKTLVTSLTRTRSTLPTPYHIISKKPPIERELFFRDYCPCFAPRLAKKQTHYYATHVF
jgi:hypothetical protein